MLKPPALAVAIALLATAPALADLPKVPKHAKKMTQEIADNATFVKLMAEVDNQEKWPQGMAPYIEPCKVTRYRGVCEYHITGPVLDTRGYYTSTRRCEGHVTAKINKRTHRVSTHQHETSCAVTGPFTGQ